MKLPGRSGCFAAGQTTQNDGLPHGVVLLLVAAVVAPAGQPVRPQIGAVAYRPDGRMLAVGTFKSVRLVDTATGKTIASLDGEAEQVRSVAFSPDGKLLAAAGGFPAQKGEVKIWDVDARKVVASISGHHDCIYAVEFSPDGKTLATASYDKLIKLWNPQTGEEIRTLKDHIDAVYDLAFTPDGKRLVSVSADRGAKVWNPATGERLYTMSEATDGLNTVALDSTGTLVATGGYDKTIRVYALGEKNAVLKTSLIAHEDAILRLDFSPDGKTLMSTAADKTLRAFKVDDLSEIKSYPLQPDWVLSLRFSPDGRKFAVGRYDGSLEFYDAPK
jgi:WD40 repeat protein